MQTLLKDGKYQILEILHESPGFRSCLCIDVETDNNYKQIILNTYEDAKEVRRLLPVFYAMRGGECSDFIDVISGTHNISSVFAYHDGMKISEFFSRADKDDFEIRHFYTNALLEAVLILDVLDDFIACGALCDERIAIEDKNKKLSINYILPPDIEEMLDFKRIKTSKVLRLIFKKNRFVPDEVYEFIKSLEQDEQNFKSMVDIYAAWKNIEGNLMSQYEKLRKETFSAYLIRIAKKAFNKKVISKLPS
jgi:hypothetical protein